MQLKFLGAAREVTGSCFLFSDDRLSFLVDCGMHQGDRETESLNFRRFGFDPQDIDFVLLTHAHIDHSGLVPRLVKAGFRGPVYMTQATLDLLHVMLPDSAYLQQMEAARAAKRGRHQPALYTLDDAAQALEKAKTVRYDREFEPAKGVRATYRDAGHILGSAIIEIALERPGQPLRKVVVSGDLGQPGRPILRDPARIRSADVLLVESTYGNRNHRPLDATLDEFVEVVNRTLKEKQGNVLVPAFAVGRTQEVLYYFHVLSRQGRFSDLSIVVDSPMATAVTEITARHVELFDQEARALIHDGRNVHRMPKLRFTASVEESKSLNAATGTVIVAASGMCDGGRMRHHLKHHLSNPRTTVMITGFQAAGTLGRSLVDGARKVTIFGEEIPVRAEIATLGGFSAHADQAALLDWLGAFERPPGRVFLVHGEESVATEFAGRIRERLHWDPELPARDEVVTL